MKKDNKFSEYILKTKTSKVSTLFYPSKILPAELPITTPFTFPIEGEYVYLCLDKMGWWNPLGGHIEQNESWKDTITREAYEEAGVIISNPEPIGYILAQRISGNDTRHPKKSVLPITVSKVDEYIKDWKNFETKARGKFGFKEALELFKMREDNNQMLEIFKYIIEL